jgi:UDP-glucose 4-epimerase
MKVLVTGGAGFIGARLVKKLLDAGHEAVVFSRRPYLGEASQSGKVQVVSGDLRDFPDTLKALEKAEADCVVHLAYALTAEGEANPHWAVQVNVMGTNNLFEACRFCGVKRVIFGSSIAAYATPAMYGDRPINEYEPLLRSGSIYGTSKAFNEFMAAKYEAKYGIEIPCVRISAVYGSGREARGVTAWTSKMVEAAVNGRPFMIPIRSNQLANFIYVDDSAVQLLRLVLKDVPQYRIYNSGGVTATPRDFLQVIKKYIPDADIQFDEKAPQWPYPFNIDGSRLEQEITYKPREPHECLLEQLNQERSTKGMPLF